MSEIIRALFANSTAVLIAYAMLRTEIEPRKPRA